jgi:hypothetical protein
VHRRLSRSLQKLQRAGIVSKVISFLESMTVEFANGLQERHQGSDDDQNIYNLAQVTMMLALRSIIFFIPWFQEDLPDLLLSNHESFFVKLNLLQTPLAAPALLCTPILAAAAVTSPKLGCKKAPSKVPIAGSPLCSPPSTPRLQGAAAGAVAASAAVAAVVDLKLESGLDEAAPVNSEAASSTDMQIHHPTPVSRDGMPASVEAQD